jgi:phage terminase small subunit
MRAIMTALRLLRPRSDKAPVVFCPIPDPPEHLDPVAAAKWREIVATLAARAHEQGVMDMLTLYAVEWSRWRSAEDECIATISFPV